MATLNPDANGVFAKGPASAKRFGSTRNMTGRILGLIAVFGSMLVFGESWSTLIIFEIAAIYLCSEILASQLPWSLSSAMKRNSIRQDGSWSRKREKTELKAVEKLRWDIRVVMFLVLMPTTFLAYMIDREVVPLRVGFSGLFSLRATEGESIANLSDEENKFDKWSQTTSLHLDRDLHKRALWGLWPFALLIGLIWIIGCCVTIRMTFIYQLKELAKGIERRGFHYIHYDRSRGLV